VIKGCYIQVMLKKSHRKIRKLRLWAALFVQMTEREVRVRILHRRKVRKEDLKIYSLVK